MSHDHLYYRHVCTTCARTTWDVLPMLVCPLCLSPDVRVTFDLSKRAAALAEHVPGVRLASDLDRPPSY